MLAMSGGTGNFAGMVSAESTGGFVLATGTNCAITSPTNTTSRSRFPQLCILSSAFAGPASPLAQE